jgi:hypothetical protein
MNKNSSYLNVSKQRAISKNIKTMKNQGRMDKVAQSDVEDQKGEEGTQ